MATNALHTMAPEAAFARSSRFTDRMSACKGTFDRGETSTSRQAMAQAAVVQVKDLPAHEAGNQPEDDSNESFLQLYMKAFAAARQ